LKVDVDFVDQLKLKEYAVLSKRANFFMLLIISLGSITKGGLFIKYSDLALEVFEGAVFGEWMLSTIEEKL